MLKHVGTCIYAHCSNFDEWKSKCLHYIDEHMFNELYQEAYVCYSDAIAEKHYVLKFNRQNTTISLISSPDWDVRQEPTAGDYIIVKFDKYGTVSHKYVKGRNQIYHNKWMFVQPDYKGFNITAAKLRTVQWNKIPGIQDLKYQIGYRKFWNMILKQHNLSL